LEAREGDTHRQDDSALEKNADGVGGWGKLSGDAARVAHCRRIARVQAGHHARR